jgi:hypothetical protein
MRRIFWLAMGVTIGVLVVRRMQRVAERLTPSGIAESIGGGLAELSSSLRDFSADVRQAMGEREQELRAGTGLDGSIGKVKSDAVDDDPSDSAAGTR